MDLFRRFICPTCLADIRSASRLSYCARCGAEVPVRYIAGCQASSPLAAFILSWSQSEVNAFLAATTLVLTSLSPVWQDYSSESASPASDRKVVELKAAFESGLRPEWSGLEAHEACIWILRHMPRWGSRTLITRARPIALPDILNDLADRSMLSYSPTILLIMGKEEHGNCRRNLEGWLNNYLDVLLTYGLDPEKESRQLVVVFNQAEAISDLPPQLHFYLAHDPWQALLDRTNTISQMDTAAMQLYVETMRRSSDRVGEWFQQDAAGKNFVRLAASKRINLRFSLISTEGTRSVTHSSAAMPFHPCRVLEPFFWALEFQSQFWSNAGIIEEAPRLIGNR